MSQASDRFATGLKDAERLLERFDREKQEASGTQDETLKRAALVMALAAWETYVKDRFEAEFDTHFGAVKGSPIGKFVGKRRDEDLKRFFNPNSERTARLFTEYFDVDITRGWEWDNYKPADARKTLDKLIAKRGDAAHKTSRMQTEPHLVKRDELEKALRFLRGLVDASEKTKIAR